MITIPASKVAELTGGQLHGADVDITGKVVTDSREADAGSLYVARVGEHADGHDFVSSAIDNGAVAVMGLRAMEGVPTIVVDDSDLALAKLGRGVVDAIDHLAVVGITGSSGKTSTKDLLGACLSTFGETVAPYGSLNSEVGVPLTVCRLTHSSKHLVAEMGASGVGHITYLTKIAPPRIGIVLNVGKAHVGEFGSVEAIAKTKGELVEALSHDGVAILNADDRLVMGMASRTSARVITVGQAPEADYRATDVVLDPAGRASYHLTSPHGEAEVALAVHGEHQVGNSLAVIAAAVELGYPLPDVVKALAEAKAASRWRMEVHELGGGVTLINDAYNANPESMRAAMRSLAQMGAGRHTIAVLGAMRELGDSSESEHEGVGRYAAEQGVNEVVVVGEGAKAVGEGAQAAGLESDFVHFTPDADTAHEVLAKIVQPGHILLLKSSRDSGLRYLGDRLVDESGTSAFPATEVTS